MTRDTMITKSILLAGLLAFSSFGCSTDGEPQDLEGGGPVPDFCPDRRQICVEDTICMKTQCLPAFDRDYELRLSLIAPGRIARCPEESDCPLPSVTVYYSEADSPILESADPRAAQIEVIEGSSLVIEIQNDECVIPLTVDRLRSGQAMCTLGGLSAGVVLEPMQHASD